MAKRNKAAKNQAQSLQEVAAPAPVVAMESAAPAVAGGMLPQAPPAGDFSNEASDGAKVLADVAALQEKITPTRGAQSYKAPIRIVINDNGRPLEVGLVRNNNVSFAEQVACAGQKDVRGNSPKYVVGNFKWGGAEKDFPKHPHLRTVGKYFPNAIGGPLMIDFAKNKAEKDMLERKRPILKDKGFRYLIQTEGMGLQEAFMQLGEVKTDVVDNGPGATA